MHVCLSSLTFSSFLSCVCLSLNWEGRNRLLQKIKESSQHFLSHQIGLKAREARRLSFADVKAIELMHVTSLDHVHDL